jgi:hypothetical protein
MEANPVESEIREGAPYDPDKVREIPKWASRYAHNQTLPVLANLGAFVLAWAAIAGSSTMANLELQAGNLAAAWVLGTVALAACALWGWLVATRRLARLGGALSGRLYGAEGTAVAAIKPYGRPRADIVALAFGLCVVLSAAACFAFETASRNMLPIMAAYLVPFLLYLWAKQGGMAAPFMLLWPGLLLIHAVLAFTGVQPFSGEPGAVTILVPIIGYGAIAALASLVYSRIALRRLRRLARRPGGDETGGGQHA